MLDGIFSPSPPRGLAASLSFRGNLLVQLEKPPPLPDWQKKYLDRFPEKLDKYKKAKNLM
jgi:hypothetical protein